MKKYTVSVHGYPQEFIVSANSDDEAIRMAEERFIAANQGQSIFTSEILGSEEIK